MKDPVILEMLQGKNRCLSRFQKMSADFALKAESGNIDDLESFQKKREVLMKTLDLFDRRISAEARTLSGKVRDEALMLAISRCMEESEGLIQSIGEVGARIIASLQVEQEKLMREIAKNQNSCEKIGKFKSAWVPPAGEELDRQL